MSFKRTAIGITTIALVIIAIIAVAAIAIVSIGSQSNRSKTGQTSSHVTTQDQSCLSSQGTRVQWNVAVSAILSGQVTCAFQTHHLDVTLSFRNGTRWVASEPAIDDVFHVISQCGTPCANMTTATE